MKILHPSLQWVFSVYQQPLKLTPFSGCKFHPFLQRRGLTSSGPRNSMGVLCVSFNALLLIHTLYRQLRARRALLQIKDVPLRTRRVLLPMILYSSNALLVLNGTSLSCNNALLALNWRYIPTDFLLKINITQQVKFAPSLKILL